YTIKQTVRTKGTIGQMQKSTLTTFWLHTWLCFKWPLTKVGLKLCMMQSTLLKLAFNPELKETPTITSILSCSLYLVLSSHLTSSLVSSLRILTRRRR
ncbi:unnamed protein product, partial [Candidula unifasciata]